MKKPNWFEQNGWKYDSKDHCWKKGIDEKKKDSPLLMMHDAFSKQLDFIIWKSKEKEMFPDIPDEVFMKLFEEVE